MPFGSAPVPGPGLLSSHQGSSGSSQLPPAGALRSHSAVTYNDPPSRSPFAQVCLLDAGHCRTRVASGEGRPCFVVQISTQL